MFYLLLGKDNMKDYTYLKIIKSKEKTDRNCECLLKLQCTHVHRHFENETVTSIAEWRPLLMDRICRFLKGALSISGR